ncbi:MAG TPA: lipid A export permease/ATP-binding protein MsbA [Gallionellaceae bacterium]|nr:lipid A export permease/ATP-binding protein MsbA [Gallionellaceae bacterium]
MSEMTSTQLYLRLLRYVKPYWPMFAASIAGMALSAATEPLAAGLLKPFINGTFIHKDAFVIRWTPVFILVIFFARGVASFVGTYAINWVGNKVVMDLRNAMFAKLLTMPARYYDDHVSGSLISKLTYDVTQVSGAATQVVTVTVRDTIVVIGLLGVMAWYNWKLTLLAFVVTPLIVVVMTVINRRLRSTSRSGQRAMGDMTHVVQESVQANRVVKLFGGQAYEGRRFHEQANWVRRFAVKQATAAAANVPIVQFIVAMALATIIYVAIQQSRSGELSVGAFLSFVVAMGMLSAPIKRLTGVSEYMQRGLAASESIFALLDSESETDTGTTAIGRASGRLEFSHVEFYYSSDERKTLQDINLAIPAGQTVALVGKSGSGKSTLANLVPRFYTPTGGQITLDGHDLKELTLASLRANISLVSQEVVLFNDTVAANIAYGQAREVPEAEIRAAAKAAHALEFIEEMEDGFNTLIGEKGVRLSGGQRQRLAIARALLKNAPILILDEATSALDTESERHVQAALDTLMRGRTTLIIAHRLSTIEKADRIVVLQGGRIVESGTHAELLAKNGVYSQLHRTSVNQGIGEIVQ